MTSSSRSQRGLDWRINLLSQVANEVKNVRVSCGASNMLEAEVYIIRWGKQRFFLVGARPGEATLQRCGKEFLVGAPAFMRGTERFSAGEKSHAFRWTKVQPPC